MPNLDGLEATRRLLAGNETPTRVLILTTFELNEYVYQALRAGASGFLIKDAPAEQLIDAVRIVAAGDALLSPSVTRRVIEEFARLPAPSPDPLPALDALTAREIEVLRLVAQGPLEPRDRPDARPQRDDRQDPRQPPADEARPARPRPSRRLRLRDRTRPAPRFRALTRQRARPSRRRRTSRAAQLRVRVHFRAADRPEGHEWLPCGIRAVPRSGAALARTRSGRPRHLGGDDRIQAWLEFFSSQAPCLC